MTIIDSTTVSVLFALVAVAFLTGVVALAVAWADVHAAGRPARVARSPRAAYPQGRLAH